jgi:outer membrane beta-barrel protein
MKLLKVFLIIFISLSTTILKATEKDLYDFMWLDPDKKVYVLQNKVHKKEHTIYFNAGYAMGLSSTFVDTSGIHGNLGYYLNEEWAIEGLFTNYSNKDNESFQNIQNINGVVPFIRKTNSNYGVLVKWSPFYGKVNTFNKIFYFDWAFGLGGGKINTESNADTVSTPSIANEYKKESYASIIAKTELSLHATKNINVSLGLIMNNYSASGPKDHNKTPAAKLRNNLDAALTIGFSF